MSESEATVSDALSGTQVKVTVSGRNSKGGESAATAPVNATVP